MRKESSGVWPVAAMVLALAAGPALAATWQTVTDPAEKFSIALPGPAERSVRETPLDGGGSLTSVGYKYAPDGAVFVVSITQLGAMPPPAKVPAALSNSADAMISKDGGLVAWKRETVVSGRPAVEAEYALTRDGEALRARVLVTSAHKRLYSVIMRQPSGDPIATQERVARSLRILD